MKKLSLYDLKRLVSYDPNTGIFTRKVSFRKTHPVGSIIGKPDKDGYLSGCVLSVKYQMHRLAWFYYYGEFPEDCIDHIDNDKANNKISNLRIANKSQNGVNRGLQKNNTSGFKGVYWVERLKRWVVYLKKDKKPIYIGTFKDKLEAARAYDEALVARFGAFAKTNLR